jgi:hypothetical protein
MRDQQLASDIAYAKHQVAATQRRVLAAVSHAVSNDAMAHAALYEDVLGCLASARKQLERAYEVMRKGDPEDYRAG